MYVVVVVRLNDMSVQLQCRCYKEYLKWLQAYIHIYASIATNCIQSTRLVQSEMKSVVKEDIITWSDRVSSAYGLNLPGQQNSRLSLIISTVYPTFVWWRSLAEQ